VTGFAGTVGFGDTAPSGRLERFRFRVSGFTGSGGGGVGNRKSVTSADFLSSDLDGKGGGVGVVDVDLGDLGPI
jgi:hypothetical protein